MLTSGARIGPFEVLSALGAGGMGEVYRARDPRLEREIALKVLPAATLADETARARMVREARLAAQLNHPHVCTVHEVGEAEGQVYIAMELVEGRTLATHLAGGALPAEQVLRYGAQVADALAHAHARGVVHRDLKSGNVVVTPEGRAKVLDFGLAKRLAGEDLAAAITLSRPSPDERYQKAEEVRVALETVRAGGAVTALPPRDRGLRRYRWPVAAAAVAAVLAILVVLDVSGVRRLLGGGGGQARVVRMAVLPFANLSGDPEQEYLSDGITQEMISQLGRLHPEGLSVIARTSVMRYKNGDTPVDQIGRELHVDYVLEGSAQREAGRIRIAAELIHVQDQAQIWADTYERELAGILALQSEVAQKVAKALALTLLPAEQIRLANVRQVNPEAYEAYLKGRHNASMATRSSLETAQRYYDLALKHDPDYAAAWAGIAGVWLVRGGMGITPRAEAYPMAKEAALKALDLDDTAWEVHRALASILTWGDWNWTAAETEWNRMIELHPDDGGAIANYSHFLMHMGRTDEAMVWIKRALELDPFNARVQSFYALDLLYVRRYDDAIAAARAALRLQADAPVARFTLYYAFFLKGMYDEALALDRERVASNPALKEALEQGYAEAGYAGAQKRLADVLAARYGEPGAIQAGNLASIYLFAGEKARALEWLEKAFEVRDAALPYLGLPIYDPVRADPRFQDLLRRMNLPRG